MAKSLTKIELIAKINALEAQVAADIVKQDAMQAELNALYAAQRPSRQAQGPALVGNTTLTFKQRCAAARELSMRTGAVVKL